MSRFSSLSLGFTLLPVAAVIGAMALQTPRGTPTSTDESAMTLYLTPSPSLDAVHITQLKSLRQTAVAYDRLADRQGVPRRIHVHLTADYAVIVRETTPDALVRAGLPSVLN